MEFVTNHWEGILFTQNCNTPSHSYSRWSYTHFSVLLWHFQCCFYYRRTGHLLGI